MLLESKLATWSGSRAGVRASSTRPSVFPTIRGSEEANVSASVYGLVFRAKLGNPTLKLVLLALADNANDNGYCYPSINHLVEKSELSKRQVLRYLERLEEDHLMRRQSGIGRGNCTEFFLDLEAIREKVSPMTPLPIPRKVSPKTPFTGEKVSPEARKGVIQDVKGDIFDAYKEETSEPSLEPSLEPSFSLSPQEPPKPSLHKQVQTYIQTIYQQRFSTPPSWDASEAKQLKSAIDANPTWTFPLFKKLIDNRYASEGVNGERPRIWLGDLGKYTMGPLDKFGKPLGKTPVIEQRVLSVSEKLRARAAGVTQ